MAEDILANIEKEEGDIGIDELLKENNEQEDSPADSPSEEEEVVTDPSEEGEETKDEESQNTPDEDNLPFHKHPRWKQMQEDLHSKDDTIKELEGLKDTVQQLQTKQETSTEKPLPAEWTALYGDDDASRKAYGLQQNQMTEMESRIRENIIKGQEASQQKQQTEQQQADKWVDSEIQTLVDAGEKFDRNGLMKVALDMQPTDEKGNISFTKALQIYRLQEKKPDKTAQKQVAAQTSSTNQGDAKVDTSPSTNSLRASSFQSLAQN